MMNFFRHKIAAHFHPVGAMPSGQVASVLVLTLLLFAVANAYRNPPGLLVQLDEPTAVATTNTRDADELFAKLTAPGNIVLHFDNFDYSTIGGHDKVMFEYIRAAYSTYPKRVYVADASAIVPATATGNPFPDFSPSADWLDAHHVAATIDARLQPTNIIRYYAVSRKQP